MLNSKIQNLSKNFGIKIKILLVTGMILNFILFFIVELEGVRWGFYIEFFSRE